MVKGCLKTSKGKWQKFLFHFNDIVKIISEICEISRGTNLFVKKEPVPALNRARKSI